jgi:hypothetical protein
MKRFRKIKGRGVRICVDNRGWTIHKERRGDEAVKLKDVGNVMLDFLKVPCSIPVNNVSWKRLNVETKFLGKSFFIRGKWFPLRKNSEIGQKRTETRIACIE